MKTRDEITRLKMNWHSDPNWDIETTEGFEEHREELLVYRKQCEAEWSDARQKRHDYLTSLICPVMSDDDSGEFTHCKAEKCAWWNSQEDKCNVILPAYFQAMEIARRER